MRRTLTVLVATAALLAPAAAASAGTNASCNNGKGGNYAATGHTFNGNGKAGRAGGKCAPKVEVPPVDQPPADQPPPDKPVDETPPPPGDGGGFGG